jgi:hypothetical protein
MRTTVKNKLHIERLRLISWCEAFLENFIVEQPVNKFVAFMMEGEKGLVHSDTEIYP